MNELIIELIVLKSLYIQIVSLIIEMATTQEGYGMRYQKIKNNKLRSVSPSHYEHGDQSPRSNLNRNSGETQLGKVVAQLSDRVDGIQIKIVNITNIIKLFQKYTETKDIQYEREKENQEFRKITEQKVGGVGSLEIQAKINEFQSLIQKTKAQITAMEGLRISIERENSKKTLNSPEAFQTIPKTIQSPTTNTKQMMSEIEDIMDQMELNLRQQMNKKMDICMSFFKNASQSFNSSKNNSPSSVNAIMMQEQIHNITLTMNKVQSDCNRNKMIIENKIQQIVDYVNAIKKKVQSSQRQIKQNSKSPLRNSFKNDRQQSYSEHSSISKRQKKSKSKQKSKRNIAEVNEFAKTSRVEEQKKQKQMELREALRKKKQNQQKLKMKK